MKKDTTKQSVASDYCSWGLMLVPLIYNYASYRACHTLLNTVKINTACYCFSFVKVGFLSASDGYVECKLRVAMGTGLRDVVKGLMGVLDLTVPAQGTELWKTSGGGENAPGWVNPDRPLFLHSIGAVCFCFSQQAESHRNPRQPDQETTEADSFHLSWFRTVILHLHQLWSLQASTDRRLKSVLSRGWLSIYFGLFKRNTAVVKRGHRVKILLQRRRHLRAYLRAKGKLRQALVDTFRGLSNGLFAAGRTGQLLQITISVKEKERKRPHGCFLDRTTKLVPL